MKLFDILGLHTPAITPANSKLHLATTPPGGGGNPLDAYFAGHFEAWQSWQNKKNFERAFIVSLIKLSDRDRWLFAGCYRRLGRTWVEDPMPPHWSYATSEVEETAGLSGRVVVSFRRSGRAPYRNAERCAPELSVCEVRDQRMSVGDFPGYHRLLISRPELELIVGRAVPSWKAALAAVAGVYLITDTHTGRLYVGSATGDGGIWDRWCQYASNGHGGNKELRKLLDAHGTGYLRHFQYAVLEIADTHTSVNEVRSRESHWKRVLGCREHGYNGN